VTLPWVLMWLSPLLAVAAAAAAGRPRLARLLLGGAAVGWWAAAAILGEALVAERWEYVYAADHARSAVPGLARLAGLWAGPEGSLLLWTAMVGSVAWLAARRGQAASAALLFKSWAGTDSEAAQQPWRRADPAVWTVRLAAGCAGAYGLVAVTQAYPFERSDVPAVDGLGLQPVLEHPAMLWHPPLLYAGLVGLLLPAFTSAGARLAGRDPQPSAAALAVPLALLAAGLISGARWAYAEVGWGGYWAWDPIETSGLVAFCAGAAALHRGIRHPLAWVLPGVAAIWATTLTRVGLVNSVHAFADRPGLRTALLATALGMSAALAAASAWPRRAPDADAFFARRLKGSTQANDKRATGPGETDHPKHDPPRQDTDKPQAQHDQTRTDHCRARRIAGGRFWASAILLGLAFVAALGTYRPLVEAAVGGDRLAVTGRYFSVSAWPPVMAGLVVLIRIEAIRGRPVLSATAASLGAVVSMLVVPSEAGAFGLLLAAGSGAAIVLTLSRARPDWWRTVAHLGVCVLLVGVASTLATQRSTVAVGIGETVQAAGIEIRHEGVVLTEGEIPTVTATAVVDGKTMRPALRSFPLRGASTSEIAHRISGIDELQLILVDATDEVAAYRVHRVPGVVLVWLGGTMVPIALLGHGLRHCLRRLRSKRRSRLDGPEASDGSGGPERPGARSHEPSGSADPAALPGAGGAGAV